MDPRVHWAQVELERRMAERISVAELARATNLSPSRFAHLFRAHAGVPPVQYLRTLRLARAKVLLERTFLSVKEVMAQVGFTDPSHFTRDFERAHGVTPSELRAQGWLGSQRHPGNGDAPGIERRSSFGQPPAPAAHKRDAPRRGRRPKVR